MLWAGREVWGWKRGQAHVYQGGMAAAKQEIEEWRQREKAIEDVFDLQHKVMQDL